MNLKNILKFNNNLSRYNKYVPNDHKAMIFSKNYEKNF